MQTKERILFWDILKGYGIISIVLGHCCPFATNYVYTYHLALFFFVSAYFYNEKKYVNKPFDYVGNLFKNNWTKYVFYMAILVLFHNIAVRFALYTPQAYYAVGDMLNMIAHAVVFSCGELFGGAMWFVLPNIVSCAILALSVTFSDRVGNLATKERNKNIIKYSVLILMAVGYSALLTLGQYTYNVNLSFLVAPLCVTAYFIRKISIEKLLKFLNPFIAVFFGFLIYLFVERNGFAVSLSTNVYPGRIGFTLLSLIGIYVCMYLSKVTQKIPYFNKAIAFLGRYSFAIMALHFVAIKVCDRLYGFMLGEKDPFVLGQWVSTYPQKLWWVYLITGTVLPAVFGWLINKLKVKIENKIKSDA